MLKKKVESSNHFNGRNELKTLPLPSCPVAILLCHKESNKLGYYRAIKVIKSCETIEQLRVAKKYANLAIKDYLRKDGCFGTVWDLREELQELISDKHSFVGFTE